MSYFQRPPLLNGTSSNGVPQDFYATIIRTESSTGSNGANGDVEYATDFGTGSGGGTRYMGNVNNDTRLSGSQVTLIAPGNNTVHLDSSGLTTTTSSYTNTTTGSTKLSSGSDMSLHASGKISLTSADSVCMTGPASTNGYNSICVAVTGVNATCAALDVTSTGAISLSNSGSTNDMSFKTDGKLSFQTGTHKVTMPAVDGAVGSLLSFDGSGNGVWQPTVAATESSILQNNGSGSLTWAPINFLVGMVVPFAGPQTSPPSGWLLCNGQTINSVSEPKYAPLFAAIGTTYGGSGSSSFTVPHLMLEGGLFIKPWLTSEVVSATTLAQSTAAPTTAFIGTTNVAGNHQHAMTAYNSAISASGYVENAAVSGNSSTVYTNSAGDHSHTVTMTGGDTYTRPNCLIMKFMIKY